MSSTSRAVLRAVIASAVAGACGVGCRAKERATPTLPASASIPVDGEPRRGLEGRVADGRSSTTSVAPIEPTDLERAVAARFEAVRAVTVQVERLSGSDVVERGSGALISAEGDVLTAAHVVARRNGRFVVVLPDGRRREATVVARDDGHDAAVLRTTALAKEDAPTPFVRPSSRRAVRGEWVVCAGHGGDVAHDRLPMRSAGVVVNADFTWALQELTDATRWRAARVKKTSRFPGMLELDCASASGMSGGPVLSLDGELLGVVTGGGGEPRTSVATPVALVRSALEHALGADPPAAAWPDPAVPRLATDAVHGPVSRRAELEAPFAGLDARRSVVRLRVEDDRGLTSFGRFMGVVASASGLVVAPAVRLRGRGEARVVAPSAIVVEGHPGARCESILAAREELALLRFTGLVGADAGDPSDGGASLVAVGAPGEAVVGETIGAVEADGPLHAGFVTALLRHPGRTAPDPPPYLGGCGYRVSAAIAAYPPVLVASALAHDVGWPTEGALLVDRRGGSPGDPGRDAREGALLRRPLARRRGAVRGVVIEVTRSTRPARPTRPTDPARGRCARPRRSTRRRPPRPSRGRA